MSGCSAPIARCYAPLPPETIHVGAFKVFCSTGRAPTIADVFVFGEAPVLNLLPLGAVPASMAELRPSTACRSSEPALTRSAFRLVPPSTSRARSTGCGGPRDLDEATLPPHGAAKRPSHAQRPHEAGGITRHGLQRGFQLCGRLLTDALGSGGRSGSRPPTPSAGCRMPARRRPPSAGGPGASGSTS